jgi:hypothetical protein
LRFGLQRGLEGSYCVVGLGELDGKQDAHVCVRINDSLDKSRNQQTKDEKTNAIVLMDEKTKHIREFEKKTMSIRDQDFLGWWSKHMSLKSNHLRSFKCLFGHLLDRKNAGRHQPSSNNWTELHRGTSDDRDDVNVSGLLL